MIKRFRLDVEEGADFYIVLDIDTDKLPVDKVENLVYESFGGEFYLSRYGEEGIYSVFARIAASIVFPLHFDHDKDEGIKRLYEVMDIDSGVEVHTCHHPIITPHFEKVEELPAD